jgi:LPS-assembly protein
MLRPILILILALLVARSASAQALEGCGTKWTQTSLEFVQVTKDHIRRSGGVEITCADMQFFADEMELFLDRHQLVARGNVVFASGGSRIAADRMEFDTRARTGTFYEASGTVTLGTRVERSMFGTQEPDAYFYGERLEKLGPRKYRITKGGFTTCVQPTPRWEVTSGSVVMTLDEYALLRNALLKVKGVPVLYLPVLYYPIQDDDRATGFLIPVYGASTLQGQKISNAFFWAIGRSHDATLFHDWFSKTGQGLGGEYRYILSPAASGNARTYWLNEPATTVTQPDGSVTTRDPRRSLQIDGGFTQPLPYGLRARGHAQYFSDLTVQQLYHHDPFRASNRQRRLGGNVTGTFGSYLVSTTLQRDETFVNDTSSYVIGSLPRVAVSRSERPLGQLPLYVQVAGEYGALVREDRSGATVADRSLSRLDVTPTLRFPFTRWPFLTANSSAALRATWWSRSQDPASRLPVDESLSRRYLDLQTSLTGPTLNRIFNTPGSGYAERWKHVIEPTLTMQRVTAIDVFDRVLVHDGTDTVVGSVTRFAYGLTNRLYAKRRTGDTSTAREFATVSLTQTYYTDARAAAFDRQYQSSFTGFTPSRFSPVAFNLRLTPTDGTQGELRAEYDTQFDAIRTVSASGAYRQGGWLDLSGSWSLRRFIEGLPGFDNPDRKDHYLNAAAALRSPGNRAGGAYSFNLDVGRGDFLQQRVTGYYNAQCCGFAAEFQTFNYGGLRAVSGIAQDRRFTFSVTLAGIGTFSPPFGGLGGPQEARR